MQKGSHLVCGMYMLVGAETKNNGLEERNVGPRQEKMVNAGHVWLGCLRWLGPLEWVHIRSEY